MKREEEEEGGGWLLHQGLDLVMALSLNELMDYACLAGRLLCDKMCRAATGF